MLCASGVHMHVLKIEYIVITDTAAVYELYSLQYTAAKHAMAIHNHVLSGFWPTVRSGLCHRKSVCLSVRPSVCL